MIIINLEFLAKQLKFNNFNKEIKEVIEIDNLITEIKMISNKEDLKLKQFNKSSLIYLKLLLLQGEDYILLVKERSWEFLISRFLSL